MFRSVFKKVIYYACYALWKVIDPLFHFEEISILAYHSIGDAPFKFAVSARNLEAHLSTLNMRGVQFVRLRDITNWLEGKQPLPRKAVTLTFDDGYADFETAALPILERFNCPATLFPVGDEAKSRHGLDNDIPLLTPDSLVRVSAHPLVDVGYHGRSHVDMSSLSAEGIWQECKALFSANLFAYPFGCHSPLVLTCVKAAGYVAAVSTLPGLVKRGSGIFALPRNTILRSHALWEVELRSTKAVDWVRFHVLFKTRLPALRGDPLPNFHSVVNVVNKDVTRTLSGD